jgi:hypothetical protein
VPQAYAHPDVAASFDDLIGLGGHGTPYPHFELTGGWDGVRTVVDAGDGTGAMLAEILRVRPGVHGILVDLPTAVARADLYLLRGVINDWPNAEAVVILKSVGPDDTPKALAIETVLLGGKNRTLAEFRVLTGHAGLCVIAAGRQTAYYVVECAHGLHPPLTYARGSVRGRLRKASATASGSK